MDENKPPEEPTSAPTPEPVAVSAPPPDPTPTAAYARPQIPASSQSGGPVPFSGPADPSIPQDEKTQAMLVWILSLFIGFISPLIFYFIAKDKPFVFSHAAQCLTLAIVVTVLWIVAFILMFVVIGIFLLPIIGLASLVLTIMGAIAANAGARFEPPVTGNLAKSWFKA
jgi:uncharacterized protein